MIPRNASGTLSNIQLARIVVILACFASGGLAGDDPLVGRPTADEIVSRMLEMNQSRAAALQQYTSKRRYLAENQHFSKRAEETVSESFVSPGKKDLTIVSANGSPFIRHRVLDKVIEAELDAARDENRSQTYITPQNYQFHLIGTEAMDDHSCYVLEIVPRVPEKYLMRGRVWIDNAEFAVVRIEGSPAKNPSFWTRQVHFVRRYQKHGPFWLPSSFETESDVLIAGKSTLKIEYSDYQIGAAIDARADGHASSDEPLGIGTKR